MHVPVEEILHRLFGYAQALGQRVRLVQGAPIARRHFAIGAMAMEHLEPRVRRQPLRNEAGLGAHRRVAALSELQAALVAQAHLLPELDRIRKRGRLGPRHRQRAVDEALRLLDLHEVHRLAQRLHHAQPVRRGRRKAIQYLELREQLSLRGADVRERQALQPGLARGVVGELRCRGRRELGKLHLERLLTAALFRFRRRSLLPRIAAASPPRGAAAPARPQYSRLAHPCHPRSARAPAGKTGTM